MVLAKVLMNGEYTCGGTSLVFSGTFPYMISTVIQIIQIAVPILLIIFGMLDLGKAVVASKEDEIKKGQQLFIKRAISALIVFFVILIVQLLIRFVSGNNASVVNCFNCFVNGQSGVNACESTVLE
jgi:type IV secretory pathway TrbL component